MKFSKLFIPFAVFAALMFVACGDDSSSTNVSVFPDEVADKAELNTYDCNMSVIGKKVFVTDLGKNYECDGDEWFESYDQPKSSAKGKSSSSSSVKSSSSSKGKSSSSSGNSSSSSVLKQSSSSVKSSSSSVKSSSSRPTEILESEISVKESCLSQGACDAMVKTDVSTWHFIRKDDFGDDAEYTYTANGRDLIVTINNADGTTDTKTYSMYNMESEAGVEVAFNAAKSTCKDGDGNSRVSITCKKDTTSALPKCDMERNGLLGIKDSTYFICKSGSWTKATTLEYDTYGMECLDDGRLVAGKVNDGYMYVCESDRFRSATKLEMEIGFACVKNNDRMTARNADSVLKICSDGKWCDVATHLNLPKETYMNPKIDYGSMIDERDGKIYKTVEIGSQIWMAENLNYADSIATPSLKDRSWCLKNVAENCEVSGRLYTWEAAMDFEVTGCSYDSTCSVSMPVQGICPSGWHLPDTTEWNELFTAVGGISVAAEKLRSHTGWSAYGNKDPFGFSALPVGNTQNGNIFLTEGLYADFWSSTSAHDIDKWHEREAYVVVMYFLYEYAEISRSYKMSFAYPVRCVKDE